MSRISGDYETTNVWRLNPSFSRVHPATFPVELAERVIRYYSFKNDVVLDPFGGIGSGTAALNLDRRFVLIENKQRYVNNFLSTEREQFPKSCRKSAPKVRSSAR